MTTITVPIAEERLAKLQQVAQRMGVPAEELARASLEDWLQQPKDDFVEAAKYVMRKNQELYKRLA